MANKENLGKNLKKLRKKWPIEYNFFPRTWILPEDIKQFVKDFVAMKNENPQATFIVKPARGC